VALTFELSIRNIEGTRNGGYKHYQPSCCVTQNNSTHGVVVVCSLCHVSGVVITTGGTYYNDLARHIGDAVHSKSQHSAHDPVLIGFAGLKNIHNQENIRNASGSNEQRVCVQFVHSQPHISRHCSLESLFYSCSSGCQVPSALYMYYHSAISWHALSVHCQLSATTS